MRVTDWIDGSRRSGSRQGSRRRRSAHGFGWKGNEQVSGGAEDQRHLQGLLSRTTVEGQVAEIRNDGQTDGF